VAQNLETLFRLNVQWTTPLIGVDSAGHLVMISKQIVVSRKDRGEAYVHTAADDDSDIVATTVRLIQSERKRAGSDKDILVLSRTKHLVEKVREACQANRISVANIERDIPGVRVLSAHRAKGLEAKTVMCLPSPLSLPLQLVPKCIGGIRYLLMPNDRSLS